MKNITLETLNTGLGTIRLCHKLISEEYLNGEGRVDPHKKFTIDIPEYGIKASAIPAKEGEKFDTLLFHPEGEGRQGEGGLRTRGYFKHSYRKVDGRWYVVDYDDNDIAPVDGDIDTSLDFLPLIAIVTVVYNGEKYLEQTIRSVIEQDYPNVEYIIIDGGSTDGTLDIIKKYEDYIDYWVSEKDGGIYDAMNKGTIVSSGYYIAYINSDDWLEENALHLVSSMANIKNVDYIFGYLNKYINGEIVSVHIGKINGVKQHTPIGHQALFVKAKVMKKYLFNTQYKIMADYDLMVRLIKSNLSYLSIDKPIANFRIGGISSEGWLKQDKDRFKIQLKNFGLFTAIVGFVKETKNPLIHKLVRMIIRFKKILK